MKNQDLAISLVVDKSPAEVYAAINNVRGWWSEEIADPTDKIGGEWVYRYKDIHYSKQKTSELVPNKIVAWEVTDSTLSFTEDKTEWTGTNVMFDISPQGEKTEIRFTHKGLDPTCECFEACTGGWDYYINTSLKSLIETGKGKPNPEW
ncbi:MAG: SRPBCC domain-containing protein [Pseudomonadota bacterium]|nr:SRPBCC domain-containing protein [Pseudomonadota bacterium]